MIDCSRTENYFDLKSNMDRFIEQTISREHFVQSFLKSNMDRFIEYRTTNNDTRNSDLKSNMDRFIGFCV